MRTRRHTRRVIPALVAALAIALFGAVSPAQAAGVRQPPAHAGSTIRTVAGTGDSGYSGDGGPATRAQISDAENALYDAQGRLVVLDTYNNAVRRIDRDGTIHTIVAPSAGLLFPFGIARIGSTLYIADSYHHRIVRVTASGSLVTVAGTGTAGYSGDGAAATAAQLDYPFGLTATPRGTLLIADTFNNRIREIGRNGVIRTIAGNGERGFSGDNGKATAAELSLPYGVAADAHRIVIADTDNNRVRQVDSCGRIRTIAGDGTAGYSGDGAAAVSASLDSPAGVALRGGAVYIADSDNFRVREVVGSVIRTVVGNGTEGDTGDGGLATKAEVDFRGGIALSNDGSRLAIADTWNARVREVRLSGH